MAFIAMNVMWWLLSVVGALTACHSEHPTDTSAVPQLGPQRSLLQPTKPLVGHEVSASESVRAEGSASFLAAFLGEAGESFPSAMGQTFGVPAVTDDVSVSFGDIGWSILSYPYAVSLRRRSDLSYFCAGVLVGGKHVLTAAHCIDSSATEGDSRPKVVVGSASSTETSGLWVQVISTQNVFIHPNYAAARSPDLAILELSSAANEAPVRIPTTTDFLPENGDVLRSIGWGRTRSDSGYSEIAQSAEVKFIGRGRCGRKLGKFVHSHQICMGGDGVSTCRGDDGGPIVLPGETGADDVLVGIVGSAHVCGRSSNPDVHTNIVPFIDWIKSTAGAKLSRLHLSQNVVLDD